MSDRLLKESDVLGIALQLPLVVNSVFADAVKALPSADRPLSCLMMVQGIDCEDCPRRFTCHEMPTMEPKRGEWIQTSNDWIDGTCGTRYYPIHCSICNYSTYDDSATNFCPNCGAKMGYKDETNRPSRD